LQTQAAEPSQPSEGQNASTHALLLLRRRAISPVYLQAIDDKIFVVDIGFTSRHFFHHPFETAGTLRCRGMPCNAVCHCMKKRWQRLLLRPHKIRCTPTRIRHRCLRIDTIGDARKTRRCPLCEVSIFGPATETWIEILSYGSVDKAARGNRSRNLSCRGRWISLPPMQEDR
jgi:hypothetical protein